MIRFGFLPIALAALVFSGQSNADAQVPPEHQLPNDGDVAPLPSEHVLPGAEVQRAMLPAESRLPVQRKNKETTNEAFPAGITPILRLDYEGHTSPIHALALCDGDKRLVSAGQDKDLHIWRRDPFDPSRWVHDRTVRWQVTRGPRGRIYALASREHEVAFAGDGALGALGEIWMVDVRTGNLTTALVDFESGHRGAINSLAWLGNQPKLFSHDFRGQLIRWAPHPVTQLWQGATVSEIDAVTYGEEAARSIAPFRGFAPITATAENLVFAPTVVSWMQPRRIPIWAVNQIDAISGKSAPLGETRFAGQIRCIAASPDGRSVVALGGDRTCAWWHLDERRQVVDEFRFQLVKRPLSLAFHPEDDQVLIGTEASAAPPGQSDLQLWRFENGQATMQSNTTFSRPVAACRFDIQHEQMICAVGNSLQVHKITDELQISTRQVQTLRAPAGPVGKVSFTDRTNRYEVILQRPGESQVSTTFDLSGVGIVDQTEAIRLPARQDMEWDIRPDTSEPVFRLYEGDAPRGKLPLTFSVHGLPISKATYRYENQTVVAVGTNLTNNIYLYAADDSDPPKLLRQFRRHSSAVRSLSFSRDGRYLCSGSDDATVSVWPLQGLTEHSVQRNRWGGDFEIEDNQLTVTSLDEAGTLYFRGVRQGDVLLGISWTPRDGKAMEQSDPATMLASLQTLPFDSLISFRFSRSGRVRPTFQSYPAWWPLATLLVDNDREWAFWTPSGYYDASFNGHQRFGWQINRGVESLPDFFRAAQFREVLERPAAMRQLLARGSLPAAMRASLSRAPAPQQVELVNQMSTKPVVRVESPTAGDQVLTPEITAEVTIETSLGSRVASVKGFLSGVPAVSIQHLESPPIAEGTTLAHRYQLIFRVPRDKQLQLEVFSATDSGAIGRQRLTLDNAHPVQARRKPKMHLLAIGVSDYRDPQIQSLDFASAGIERAAAALRQHCGSFYDVTTELLLDSQATRPLWRIYAEAAANRLVRKVGPDDLVVMYLCGHGVRDRRTNQWYFVAADARYRDVMNDRYGDCLSLQDLSLLSSLPCRKLAILDSCHSGAVQPRLRDDDLKSAMRWLQNDMVITLSASEGHEEAAELEEAGLSRFTAQLIRSLDGSADLDRDGTVQLAELVQHVRDRVAIDSEREGLPQHPTASPPHLFSTMDVPMAVSAANQRPIK